MKQKDVLAEATNQWKQCREELANFQAGLQHKLKVIDLSLLAIRNCNAIFEAVKGLAESKSELLTTLGPTAQKGFEAIAAMHPSLTWTRTEFTESRPQRKRKKK